MKKYRVFFSILILALTVGAFIHYISTHPEILEQLQQINPFYALIIAFLYLAIIATLSIVNTISVRLCGKKIGRGESFNLTGSSSIANFFGPLQSGVGIRAIYFKTKLGIPIKEYGVASLYYYGLYAFFSGLLLLLGSATLRLPLLGATLLGASFTIYYIKKRSKKTKLDLNHAKPDLLIKLTGAVLLQLTLITAIYFLELKALGHTASLAQVISYSGAANFSLFVAITPGAIGIREAFLIFSEKLHGIGSEVVVAANVLDRGIYVVFLGLLFLWLITTHTRVRLKGKRVQAEA